MTAKTKKATTRTKADKALAKAAKKVEAKKKAPAKRKPAKKKAKDALAYEGSSWSEPKAAPKKRRGHRVAAEQDGWTTARIATGHVDHARLLAKGTADRGMDIITKDARGAALGVKGRISTQAVLDRALNTGLAQLAVSLGNAGERAFLNGQMEREMNQEMAKLEKAQAKAQAKARAAFRKQWLAKQKEQAVLPLQDTLENATATAEKAMADAGLSPAAKAVKVKRAAKKASK